MPHNGFVVFINGVYGAGKSAALDHVGDALAAAGHPFALMDVDWFHRSWRNYQGTGPRQLVVSGIISHQDHLTRYETALGLPVRPIRLTASDRHLEERLRKRYTLEQAHSLDWHLARFRKLNQRLVDAGLDELVIDTSNRTPAAVAREILAHFGLAGPDGHDGIIDGAK